MTHNIPVDILSVTQINSIVTELRHTILLKKYCLLVSNQILTFIWSFILWGNFNSTVVKCVRGMTHNILLDICYSRNLIFIFNILATLLCLSSIVSDTFDLLFYSCHYLLDSLSRGFLSSAYLQLYLIRVRVLYLHQYCVSEVDHTTIKTFDCWFQTIC